VTLNESTMKKSNDIKIKDDGTRFPLPNRSNDNPYDDIDNEMNRCCYGDSLNSRQLRLRSDLFPHSKNSGGTKEGPHRQQSLTDASSSSSIQFVGRSTVLDPSNRRPLFSDHQKNQQQKEKEQQDDLIKVNNLVRHADFGSTYSRSIPPLILITRGFSIPLISSSFKSQQRYPSPESPLDGSLIVRVNEERDCAVSSVSSQEKHQSDL